jgi:hypothetical protein
VLEGLMADATDSGLINLIAARHVRHGLHWHYRRTQASVLEV